MTSKYTEYKKRRIQDFKDTIESQGQLIETQKSFIETLKTEINLLTRIKNELETRIYYLEKNHGSRH